MRGYLLWSEQRPLLFELCAQIHAGVSIPENMRYGALIAIDPADGSTSLLGRLNYYRIAVLANGDVG